jgi:multiple sugar transport system permease protein
MVTRKRFPIAVLGFLAPNFLGFLGFTLFPVLFSLWMAFTNWSLKPAVEFQVLGLRNFTDLLGVRPLIDPHPGLWWTYMAAVAVLCGGLVMVLWGNVAGWRGIRLGGVVLALVGVGVLAYAPHRGGQGAYLCGALALLAGLAAIWRDDVDFGVGLGTVGPALVLAAGLTMGLASKPMWAVYEAKDPRFWQYLFNTVYLMLGIPFGILGSLGLALLVNHELPVGPARVRVFGSLICLVCGAVTFSVLWGVGWPNVALLGFVFWLMVALGVAVNVVAYRTIYYLPTFTAGVALMILWKALYNPEVGPVNAALASLFSLLHIDAKGPEWLSSVAWAKPALMIMGVWTGIGGTNMLLYLAGLSNVPRDLLDAAEVDGAGMWAKFRHVTWPQLAPTTFFISIMACIGGLQGGFDQARVMTGGGPAGSTTTLSYYIYNKAFQDLDLGYAAAISWVLFAIIFTATALNWKFGRELDVEVTG